MTSQIPDPNELPEQNVPTGAEQPAAPEQPQATQPPPPQYAQPQPQPQQGQYIPPQTSAAPVGSNLQLNYWLSVFFVWIPALIFFLTEKGKSPLLDQYNRENLNFSIIRTGLALAVAILGPIPILGWLIWAAGVIGGIVLFVFHIMAAAKAKENYDRGQAPGFIFNIPFVK